MTEAEIRADERKKTLAEIAAEYPTPPYGNSEYNDGFVYALTWCRAAIATARSRLVHLEAGEPLRSSQTSVAPADHGPGEDDNGEAGNCIGKDSAIDWSKGSQVDDSCLNYPSDAFERLKKVANELRPDGMYQSPTGEWLHEPTVRACIAIAVMHSINCARDLRLLLRKPDPVKKLFDALTNDKEAMDRSYADGFREACRRLIEEKGWKAP